jgi:tetratricopeptide (TPR) repeat protein
VAHADRALHEAPLAGDTSAMCKAHFQLSLENFWARPVLGVQHGEQAVALLEGTRERWSLGQACWILGLNLSYRGRFVDALAFQQRARTLADATGDRRLASYAAWTTGFIHSLAGDLDDAVQACRLSVELSLDPLNRMTSQGMLALALVERGDSAEACAVLDEAIPRAVQFSIPQMHGLFLAFRGEATLQRGDPEAARDIAAGGARITREARYEYGRGWAQRVQARIEAAVGDTAAAEAFLRQSIDTFQAMGAPFEVARTQVELAQLLADLNRRAEALDLAQEGVTTLGTLQAARHAARSRGVLERLSAG